MDSRVSEHLDTKLCIDLTSPEVSQSTVILLRCRPFGMSSNRSTVDFIPPLKRNPSDPDNLGDVLGGFHTSSCFQKRRPNSHRSSSSGREQTKANTSAPWWLQNVK